VLQQLSDVFKSFLTVDPVPSADEDYESAPEPAESIFDYSTSSATSGNEAGVSQKPAKPAKSEAPPRPALTTLAAAAGAGLAACAVGMF
jgi:hypothetical protein